MNEQVDWAIYSRIFLKDKKPGLAFKFLEDTTLFLNGPSQAASDDESLSESREFSELDNTPTDLENLSDSESDSEEY